ncbi:MAG: hypothetical protein JNL58_01900 [Planctomyces sp.]|nr:hypothetical protein [Planctomyces sp.]
MKTRRRLSAIFTCLVMGLLVLAPALVHADCCCTRALKAGRDSTDCCAQKSCCTKPASDAGKSCCDGKSRKLPCECCLEKAPDPVDAIPTIKPKPERSLDVVLLNDSEPPFPTSSTVPGALRPDVPLPKSHNQLQAMLCVWRN